jgi:hypothetical protein
MNRTMKSIARHLIITATLGAAAFASWAMTESRAPAIEASITINGNG